MKSLYKVIIFLFAFLFLRVELSLAQEQLILPLPPNMKSVLIHTYTVVGPKQYIYHARKLKNLSYELAKFESMSIDVVDGIEDLPDVVFVIDDSSADSKTLMNEAYEANAIVIPLAPNDMMEPEKTASDIGAKTTDKESYQEQLQFISYVLRFLYYSGQRPIDVEVFNPKSDKYGAFRAPTIIKTAKGTLIAIAEGQKDINNDFSPTDIVLKISSDNGTKWSEIRTIAKSAGGAILVNPTVVGIKGNNQIAVLYGEMPARDEQGVLKSGQLNRISIYVCFSSDNGRTWSKPRDITSQVKLPAVASYRVGSGLGICVAGGKNDGRLIIPCWTYSPGNWYNYIIYSDDNGINWKIASGRSAYGIGESQMVQISDTSFLLNAASRRSLYDKSYNIPKGWNPQNFERTTRNRAQMIVSLTDSVAVWSLPQILSGQPDAIGQGSLIRYSDFSNDSDSILLMSNSASKHSWPGANEPYMLAPPVRINGTVRISFDNGKSWEISNRIYGNRFTAFQNSVLVRLDDDLIGCIFDTNLGIKFTVFDLDWLKGVTPRERKYEEFYRFAY